MEIKLDLPEGVFDREWSEADFVSRVRELAILELLRVRRLHEHEAQRMLGLERWELVERMQAVGIAPTERAFGELKDELEAAIATARARRASGKARG